MEKLKIDILPSPTWRWLHVNQIEIDNIDTIGLVKTLEFKDAGTKVSLPLMHENSVRDCIDINTAPGSRGTLVIDHSSAGGGICAGLTLNYFLAKDSELTIVQVVRMDDKDSLLSGFVGEQDANSRLNIIQVFKSGANVYSNNVTALTGKGAYYNLKSAYELHAGNMLDLNYVVYHIAPKTECALESKGVLYKGAEKTYRGTIDFRKGCKGAVGNETEDVLLMDDDIINKTVPVILCSEEDVEGNHGATIGKISDELMFYLASRGIPEAEIYDMLAKGRMESIIRLIPDEKLKEELLGNKDVD